MIRAERPSDVDAIRAVQRAAFRHPAFRSEILDDPPEAGLVDALRADPGWIPELSLVAERDGVLIGHAVATRAWLRPGNHPVLGLGPIGVLPEFQRTGAGSALMRELIAAGRARGEELVGLLGDPEYYGRFGFQRAREHDIVAPEPQWGDFFQVLRLSGTARGTFHYATPFDHLG